MAGQDEKVVLLGFSGLGQEEREPGECGEEIPCLLGVGDRGAEPPCRSQKRVAQCAAQLGPGQPRENREFSDNSGLSAGGGLTTQRLESGPAIALIKVH